MLGSVFRLPAPSPLVSVRNSVSNADTNGHIQGQGADKQVNRAAEINIHGAGWYGAAEGRDSPCRDAAPHLDPCPDHHRLRIVLKRSVSASLRF